ncbi:MAG: FtsX-like permease family protein [Sphingobacteriales bacterium]|nr:MAG: FtsX-like permease family protein [Sphingobacteriales bacterium]
MLKNYFKIAIAVLRRRKFFTFISLFGISFTLTILIVLAAFINNIARSDYPDRKRDRSLYVLLVEQKNTKTNGRNTGPASFYLLDHYVSAMKTPEMVSIASFFSATNTYVNNKKLTIDLKYTNDVFWDVMEFDFLEGKPYNLQQIRAAEKIAVISEDTRDSYFGKGTTALGKYIETDNEQYRVVGVVKDVPITMVYAYGNLYLPYTLSKRDIHDKNLSSEYTGVLVAKSKADLPAMKAEYQSVLSRIPLKGTEFDQLYSHADDYITSYTRIIMGDGQHTGTQTLVLALSAFALLFMLLPTLNLININTSRIMERSSEIGVRKAFGASSGTLVLQFITENIILTLIGGVIGLLLSWGIISYINAKSCH